MEKCEPWAIAAVYLMQNPNGRAHYTNIVNYIIETQLTDFVEKSAAASHTIHETVKQKVINGRAIFNSAGNGYYSLGDEDAMRKNEQIRDVIQCLKNKGLNVTLRPLQVVEANPDSEDTDLPDEDEKLSNEAKRLSDQTRKLSDEIMSLSGETMKLSDEVTKLSEENKNLRAESARRQHENQQLKEKLQSIRQLCD